MQAHPEGDIWDSLLRPVLRRLMLLLPSLYCFSVKIYVRLMLKLLLQIYSAI